MVRLQRRYFVPVRVLSAVWYHVPLGDSVYGDDRALRLWLEECKQAYVLAVSGKESVWPNHQQQLRCVLRPGNGSALA